MPNIGAICTTIVKIRRVGNASSTGDYAYIAWGELLLYTIGLWFVYTGILHAYFYELGWIELSLGVAAMMSLWRGYEFRLAATIVSVTFALAAAAQHIQETICCGNYAQSNAGPVLW